MFSGANCRNSSFSVWVCLDEISCSVSSEPIWARLQGQSWRPAMILRNSGIRLAHVGLESLPCSFLSSTAAFSECFVRLHQTTVSYFDDEEYQEQIFDSSALQYARLSKRLKDIKSKVNQP